MRSIAIHHFFSILIFICHHILIKILVAVAVWKEAHNFRTHSDDKEVYVINFNFVLPTWTTILETALTIYDAVIGIRVIVQQLDLSDVNNECEQFIEQQHICKFKNNNF